MYIIMSRYNKVNINFEKRRKRRNKNKYEVIFNQDICSNGLNVIWAPGQIFIYNTYP